MADTPAEDSIGDDLLEAVAAQDSPPKAAENRAAVRHPIHLKVLVIVEKQVLHGRTEDLSTGGAGLRLEVMLTHSQSINVRFLVPFRKGFDHLDVAAQVCFASLSSSAQPPCRIGVKFVKPDAKFLSHLGELLQR